MKNIIIYLALILLLFSCTVGKDVNVAEDDTDINLTKKSSITVKIDSQEELNSGIQKSTIVVEEHKIVEAEIILSSPSGIKQTKTWTPDSTGTFTFSVNETGFYTITVIEKDDAGNEVSNSTEINVKIGYNYQINITLGGTFFVDIEEDSFEEYIYIQFEDIDENILNIKQIEASKNSYKIIWDEYPDAVLYRIYRKSNDGFILLDEIAENEYLGTSQRAGFWIYTDDNKQGGALKIYPVVSGNEVEIDYIFAPLLFDENEVVIRDYTDNFDDNLINPIYEFTYNQNKYLYEDGNVNDNNQVYEANGVMNLDVNTSYGYPRLHVLCKNYMNKNLTIKSKISAHKVDNLNRTAFRKSDLIVGMNSFTGVTPNQYGLYVNNTHTQNEVQITSEIKYDQWIDFGIFIDKINKKAAIFYGDDEYIIDYDDSYEKSSTILITFTSSSWSVGHEYKIDDLEIIYE